MILVPFVEWLIREKLIQADEGPAVVTDYTQTLQTLPPDLLRAATTRIKATWHYRSKPLPGDLRQAVSDQWKERTTDYRRLQTMEMKARLEMKQKSVHSVRKLEKPKEIKASEPEPILVDPNAKENQEQIAEWKRQLNLS